MKCATKSWEVDENMEILAKNVYIIFLVSIFMQ